jgi:hypothetical protein
VCADALEPDGIFEYVAVTLQGAAAQFEDEDFFLQAIDIGEGFA